MLNQNLFFIEEHVGLLKAANNYDVYNPRTQEIVITCREEKLDFLTKLVRFTFFKTKTSFNLVARANSGETLLTVKRGASMVSHLAKVNVLDENENLIGKFKQKMTLKGNFEVLDADDQVIYNLNKSGESDFTFAKGDAVLANISKKWAGASKELLTTADNYLLQVMVTVPPNDPLRQLIFASVLCIDMILYE